MRGSAPADLIAKAGKLLSNPGNWCQGALARTARGKICCPMSRRAKAWDMAGAAYHIAYVKPTDFKDNGLNDVGKMMAVFQIVARELYNTGFVTVNDTMGHTEVMEVMRAAYMMVR